MRTLNMRIIKQVAILICLIPSVSFADLIELDFGHFSNPQYGTVGNLELKYENVAQGINASLTSAKPFQHTVPGTTKPNQAGAKNGDAFVNIAIEQNAFFTFRLFDANVGDGYQSLYTPAEDYSFVFSFLDIDGRIDRSHDILWLFKNDFDDLYLTDTSTVKVDDTDPDFLRFSGNGGNVRSHLGVTPPLSQEELDATVSVLYKNRNSISFWYAGGGTAYPGGTRGMIIDGTLVTQAFSVSEPSTSIIFVFAGMALLYLRRNVLFS